MNFNIKRVRVQPRALSARRVLAAFIFENHFVWFSGSSHFRLQRLTPISARSSQLFSINNSSGGTTVIMPKQRQLTRHKQPPKQSIPAITLLLDSSFRHITFTINRTSTLKAPSVWLITVWLLMINKERKMKYVRVCGCLCKYGLCDHISCKFAVKTRWKHEARMENDWHTVRGWMKLMRESRLLQLELPLSSL